MLKAPTVTLSIVAVLASGAPYARAADAPPCFDFTHADGVKALATPLAFGAADHADTTASGPHAQGGGWGAARASLAMPIAQALRLLRDQTVLKNPKDSDLSIHKEPRAGLLDFQTVEIAIHPFPLISIRWIEQWAYRVTQGLENAPREALIAYQKISGTEHIKHFCGNIWLKAENGDKTDFAVYEETDATRRSAEDIARGHLGTLRTLRERAATEKP